MKNKFLGAAALLISLSMCNTASGYDIKGKIAGVKKGIAILNVREPSNLAFADTVKISNGKFAFKGEIKDALYASLNICPENQESAYMNIILEDAPMVVTESWDSVIEQYGMRYFKNNNYTGGANSALSVLYGKQYKDITNQDKYATYRKAMKELEAIHSNKDESSIARCEKIKKDSEADSEKIQKESLEASINLINGNKDTEYSAYILKIISNKMTLQEIETIFNTLTPKVQNSYFAQDVKSEIKNLKAVAPGQPAPDFTLKTTDGSKFTLSSLKGKYVVVDFWASWCAPCRAAVPELKDIYAKYKELGFEIVGVTNDSREKDWLKAVGDDQTTWIHVIDEFPIKNKPAITSTLYGIHFLPSYFLIDKNGKMMGKFEKADLKNKLKEIFGK